MEHIFQLLIAVLGGGLVAGIAAGLTAFYMFHGRLSRVEAQLDLLRDILSNNFSVNLDGISVPIASKKKPVGGQNAVAETLKKESKDIRQEEVLTVFELITDGRALTNLVLGSQVRINDISLKTLPRGTTRGGSGAGYAAVISLENATNHDIEFVIPKGQVFENREPKSRRQNLAAANERKEKLAARSRLDMVVEAHCMNKELRPPSGNPGNLTIFKIRDDKFRGQTELWQSINDGVNRAKLVVEGTRK